MSNGGLGSATSNNDFRNNSNAGMFSETNTRWIKFSAWLPWLAPSQDPNGAGGIGWDYAMLDRLDLQIIAARQTHIPAAGTGIGVILSLDGFPRWMNGTAGVTEQNNRSYMLYDRIREDDYRAGDWSRHKALEYKVPDDVSTAGAWANLLFTLVNRYSPYNPTKAQGNNPYCYLDGIEILNEPNTLLFPQQSAPSPSSWTPWENTTQIMGAKAAEMMKTAKTVIGVGGGGRPLLLGPGILDYQANSADGSTIVNSRTATDHRSFATGTLSTLAASGFQPGPSTIWTIHNYGDCFHGTNRAAAQRKLLRDRLWRGWPDENPYAPNIWITEGGVNIGANGPLPSTMSMTERKNQQSIRIKATWDRYRNDTIGGGAGIAMFNQYLFNTDPNFDSGLRELASWNPPGNPRPAYYMWRDLPCDP